MARSPSSPRKRAVSANKEISAVSARKMKVVKSKPQAGQAPRDMTAEERLVFLKDLEGAWPDAQTELHYTTPFTLLVAVVLSAQATDASVNKVTPALFAVAPTPQVMMQLSEEEAGAYIRTIGLWRNKARNIVELSRQLVERHGGEVPDTRDDLEALAGVGRKTANVILSVLFHQPTVPVDTHVFRLANRTGLGRGKTVEAVEKKLEKVIPTRMIRDSHHWLILQGRYVCKARKPECWRCVAANDCLYPDKTDRPEI
ncbi:endonuclease III [Acetobacter thailandicus]|nr:endonuclease III [Acetobacter thailandicus]